VNETLDYRRPQRTEIASRGAAYWIVVSLNGISLLVSLYLCVLVWVAFAKHDGFAQMGIILAGFVASVPQSVILFISIKLASRNRAKWLPWASGFLLAITIAAIVTALSMQGHGGS
jgi:hypothetical protein